MKKIISLCVVLALLLSACSTVPEETTGTMDTTAAPTTQSPTTEPSDSLEDLPLYQYTGEQAELMNEPITVPSALPLAEYTVDIQYVPQVVDNPRNLPVLKCMYFMQDMQTNVSEAPVAEANQMLADMGEPYRFQFVFVHVRISRSTDAPASGQNVLDWFALSQVQQLLSRVDLIFGLTTPQNRVEYLYPITDYVTGDAQPSLRDAVPHQLLWNESTANGEIYGIPSYPTMPTCWGWEVDAQMMEQLGLTAADFQKNFWEMDDIFAKIYKANGNKPFMNLTYVSLTSKPEQDIGNGYIMDLSQDDLKVVYHRETAECRLMQEAMLRYKDAGYEMRINYSLPYDQWFQVQYGAFKTSEAHIKENGKYVIPVTPVTYTYPENLSIRIMGISRQSQQKALAATFLQLLSRDEAFRDQLSFGREGRDFVRSDDWVSAVEGEETEYICQPISPLCYFDKVLEGSTGMPCDARDGMTALETYCRDMDRIGLVSCPIVFDISELTGTMTAVKRAYMKYDPFFTNNVDSTRTENGVKYRFPRMDRELYDRMLLDIRTAGSEQVCAALQAQLDAWLEENPDWSAKVGD